MKFVAALLRVGHLELEAAQCKINLQFKVPTLVVQLGATSEFTVYFFLQTMSYTPLPTGSHMDLSRYLSFTAQKDNG